MTYNRRTATLSRASTLSRFTSEFRGKPWLMESVSWGGVGLSAVLASVGVAGLVGFESDLAKVGSGILLGGTILTEIAAARLPVHAERRFTEGRWLKGLAVGAGFCALTAWNVICGHMGMVAIDAAALADVRAPLERSASQADSARETAEEALTNFDAETTRESAMMGLALQGAFESGYVTAAGRSAREASSARSYRREYLARDVSKARAADRAAEQALEAAPKPRPDHDLWGFALVLELLKGALVWFATSERRISGNKNTVLMGENSDPRTLSLTDRRELKSRAASILATLRHMESAAHA